MEEYDDEPDLEEQIFHNNVREQIVSKSIRIVYVRITF